MKSERPALMGARAVLIPAGGVPAFRGELCRGETVGDDMEKGRAWQELVRDGRTLRRLPEGWHNPEGAGSVAGDRAVAVVAAVGALVLVLLMITGAA